MVSTDYTKVNTTSTEPGWGKVAGVILAVTAEILYRLFPFVWMKYMLEYVITSIQYYNNFDAQYSKTDQIFRLGVNISQKNFNRETFLYFDSLGKSLLIQNYGRVT